MTDFPTHPDMLTNEWLSESLAADVQSFDWKRLGEGAGLLGLVTKVSLAYAPGGRSGPETLIAKFPTPTAENRIVAETFDMYSKEVKFYSELAGQTPARAPEAYRCELNEDNNDFVLLMEDLSSCRVGDQVEGCGIEDAQRAVDNMVKLHATWWEKADTPDLAWIPLHDNPTQLAGIQGGFHAGWDNFIANFGDVLPEGTVESYKKIGDQTPHILKLLCGGSRTVVHGDYRLDNMFFDVDGDPDCVAMFDWQGICKSSGPHDLGYFISQSLLSDARGTHQESLVRRYWEQLCEHGAKDYSFDQCWKEYRIAVLYLFHYAVVIAGTLDQANERGVRMTRALASRSAETVAEVDALALLAD